MGSHDSLAVQVLQSLVTSLLCVVYDWRSGVMMDTKTTLDHLPIVQPGLLLLFDESVQVCS